MEKTLSLYTYIDGINDMPFPNADEHIIVSTFTYDAKRMGDAPSINFTIKHTTCLDSVWTDSVYASFKGEKYFLKQTPTSAYDNSDSRYKHDVVMVSERIALNEAYFFDVVSSNSSDDRPVSNSSEVVFFGDVHEFALRLNASLLHSRLDYKVIVDDGVTSEAKLMSFKNQFFSNVLQEFYNTYNMPYYFVGKEIHIGQEATIIDEVFEYGVDNSLLSIEKSNANYKVVTRCTGTGSNDNIPYYYPNPTPYGDMVCLLNGKESSNVRVIDWARFARCGVDGELSYNEKTAASGDAETPQKVYVGSSIYFNTVATAYGNEWEAQSEPFELEYAHNYLFINGSPNSQVIASWEWLVIDENNVVRANGSWSTGDTGVYLDNGVYTVKIRVRLNNTYGSNDEAQEIARNNSYIDIYKQKQQEQYTEATYTWQLNDGSYVTLNSVGVNYDGTPQVGYTISFKTKTARIPVSTSLMPPIYRESLGKDRFYVAKNNTYKKANSDDYYSFNNIFVDGRPKDHIIEVDDIKPTIANVVNANNERIDSFIEFAYDLNDNDELDAENRYEHSFFYAKLRKMDGDFGFNLFDHASESGNMTVSMTSGVCGACNWEICVDENTGQNAVRVDENGNLLRDADGNVLYKGSVGRTQNDTTTEEVWVQLRKEDNTYGILMPNKAANHRPSVGDTFVLTNISLPQAYILAAEERLKHAIIEYMAQNNDEKFNFSIKFSRIYLAQHEAIMAQLSENATLKIKYNGVIYTLHVSSYSYKMSENAALPEIVVQLSDTLTVQKNALQNAVSEIRYEVDTVVKSIDVGAMAAGQFVSKVNEDVISGTKTFLARSVFGDTVASKDFTRGSVTGVGWALYTEDVFNKVQDVVAKTTRATTTPQTVAKKQSVLELDKLIVRGKLEVNELTVNQAQFQKGTTILSGGACVIESIEVLTDSKGNSFYRCYYNNEQGTKNSGFFTGDFAKCLRFDMSSTNVVKEYWREVVGVGTAYVDLAFNGSSDDDGIPAIGDNIIQMGNKDNPDRQSFIVIDPLHKGSIQIYSGVNSFSLEDRNYVGMGVNPTTNEAYLYGYGDIYIGDRDIDAEGANFITYQKRVGDNKRKLFIAADIMLGAESTGLSNMSEFLDLKDAVDKAIETTKDIEYLKNTFESGNILEVNGAILSSLIGVTNNEGILKAGLYGGGSDTLNDKGYFDEEHGAMLLFGGIDGADKPTTYKTAIFEDGYIESEYFATARTGARVEMFDNQVKIFGSDGSTHILMGWSAETGNPELQYIDASGARPWLITSQGISNAVTLNTEQKILAVKDFDKGLKIGGLHAYKSQDDTIYLDCNLVVRGGVTAFGTNETITASIFEALPIDGVTLKRTENGVLYVASGGSGGSGGGGISIEDLDSYLTTNGYITSDALSAYLPKTGGTVNGHIKIQATNTFALTVLRNGAGASIIRFEGEEGRRGAIGFVAGGEARVWDADINNSSAILTSNNISDYALPLTGGTISQSGYWSTKFKSTGQTSSGIAFEVANGNVGYLIYADGSKWQVTAQNWSATHTLLHSGNYSDYALPKDGTAASAYKLNAITGSSLVANTWDSSNGLSVSGWNTDGGWNTNYGTSLNISGFNTWRHRLGFNTNGVIEHWAAINTTTMSKVGDIAYVANIPTKLSQLTDDVVSGKYLPLTGGSISGKLAFSGATFPHIYGDGSKLVLGYANLQTSGSIVLENNALRRNGSAAGMTLGTSAYKWAHIYGNGLTITDAATFASSVTATTFIGSLTGNAATATLASTLGGGHPSGASYKLSYLSGQFAPNATPTAGQIYIGSSEVWGVISIPNLDGTTSNANAMSLRMAFNSKFWHEIATTPNNNNLYHRNVRNGVGNSWSAILNSSNYSDYALPKDGTAVAASKLATTRSIWGQSFDGSADVSGNIFPINTSGCYYNENGISYHTNKQYQDTILRVTSSYNVAIGGTTALDKLHVYGRGRFVMQGKSDQSSIVTEATALTLSTNSAGHTGYNTGIGFNVLGDYSNLAYKNHIHAWIGLGGATTTTTSECYPLVFATNPNTSIAGTPVERMRITPDGNVAIGGETASEKLHVYGNILVAGMLTLNYSSDKRLKKNICKVNASEVLMSLGGVWQYEYIDSEVTKNHIYDGTHYGLIYQNVKGTSLDIMCHEREDGFGTLNYLDTDFISLIAGATMENISEVEKLKKENKTLRKRVEQLEKRIA